MRRISPSATAQALGALLLASACAAPVVTTLLSELDARSLPLYADYIAPTAEESRWRAIPWLPTFAEGLRTAGSERRPLLFWAMNGHPLGCT